MGKERIDKLSFTDIFMMLLCFYMHDVGMAIRYKDINEKFQSTEFKKYLCMLEKDNMSNLSQIARKLQFFDGKIGELEYVKSIDVYNDVILVIEDMYRKNHAKRSAEKVKDEINLQKDIGDRFVEILAEICEMHQRNISNIMELPYKSNGFFEDYMYPRFVASMLCLGDLLDLDTDRFNECFLESVTPLPHNSELHLQKHKSIKQFLIEPTGIELISNSNDIEVYRIMREWANWIEETCNFVAINWSEIAPDNFGIAPHVRKCELLLNGNKKWLQFANMKFEISSKRALEILKGSGIYKNKFICIREIIQNAIDATVLRIFDENLSEDKREEEILEYLRNTNLDQYKIEGAIYINDDSQVEIEIRDRGTGISVDTINLISKVSNERSDKKSESINKMPVWLRPSGAFGIGIQSIFLLTDKFQVITKTNDEKAKKIIFESTEEKHGYITIEDYDDKFTKGTQVKFTINKNKLNLNDLSCAEYHYKTKPKEILILDKINQLYSNKLKDTPPIYEMEKQEFEYVPVKINIMNPTDKKYTNLFEYQTIFNDDMDSIEISQHVITFKKFYMDKFCQIFGSIILETNEEHTYGEIRKILHHKYRNTVFYRNAFVSLKAIEPTFFKNTAIYPYIDFKINLFDKTADDVLELNRNSIKESYECNFKEIVEEAIKDTIKDIIDTLIKQKNNNIDDSIAIIYQFSRQYNYKSEKIIEKYKDELSKISFNNYYNYENNNEIDFKFTELLEKHLYFVLEEIESNDLISQSKYKLLDGEKKYCLWLKKMEKVGR
ncbi:MAG: ATP-binding protein [Lachnospiraceae bacterium]|nr:ATP-binding protein [Lachnospiraceae bacterium]